MRKMTPLALFRHVQSELGSVSDTMRVHVWLEDNDPKVPEGVDAQDDFWGEFWRYVDSADDALCR